MIPALTILTGLVAAFWLGRVWSRASRMAPRFLYDAATDPASLPAMGETPPTGAAPPPWPSVAIVVPGRNEGHILAETLGSLCAVDYPAFRVVFVDDESNDNTPEVGVKLARKYAHLKVVRNPSPPPAGWVGKTWAIQKGLEVARAEGPEPEYWLFVDSDLHFAPACLKQMVRLAQQRRSDLTSLLPFVECHTLVEKLMVTAALQLLGLVYPLSKTNNRRSKVALVAGGFLLFTRAAYESLGGHEAVRGQVIEDVAFGTLAKSRGQSVYTVATHDLMRGRMYEGWGDTFRGMKKNAFAAANYNPLLGLLFLLLLALFGIVMPAYPLLAVGLWITRPSLWTFALLVLGITAWVAMLRALRRSNDWANLPPYLAWLGPLAAVFIGLVFAGSMLDYYRGGNDWSGRKYKGKDVDTLAEVGKP